MAPKAKAIEVKATQWKKLGKEADALTVALERVGNAVTKTGNDKLLAQMVKLNAKIEALLTTLAEVDAANGASA